MQFVQQLLFSRADEEAKYAAVSQHDDGEGGGGGDNEDDEPEGQKSEEQRGMLRQYHDDEEPEATLASEKGLECTFIWPKQDKLKHDKTERQRRGMRDVGVQVPDDAAGPVPHDDCENAPNNQQDAAVQTDAEEKEVECKARPVGCM